MARTVDAASKNLKALAAELMRYHYVWQADQNRDNPDDGYWDRVNKLIDAFEAGDIPADCRKLATAVEKLTAETDRFETREDENNYYPRNEFWMAIEKIEEALANKSPIDQLKPLETVKELHEQKVPHAQIAKIYGLLDDRGEPMPHLVQKELDNPGSVINPKTWVDPRVKELQAQEEAAERYAEELQADKNAKSARTPGPETPEELWHQKVSVEQSAKILCMDEGEVQALFDKFEAEAGGGENQDAVASQGLKTSNAPQTKGRVARNLPNQKRPGKRLRARTMKR